MREGLIHYLYGTGAGKSTSAFGIVLRALGHNQNPVIIQFLKESRENASIEREIEDLKKLKVKTDDLIEKYLIPSHEADKEESDSYGNSESAEEQKKAGDSKDGGDSEITLQSKDGGDSEITLQSKDGGDSEITQQSKDTGQSKDTNKSKKSKKPKGFVYGEYRILSKKLNVPMIQLGTPGFIFTGETPKEEYLAKSKLGIRLIERILSSDYYDLLVLDEVNTAMKLGLVDVKELKEILLNRNKKIEVILTGRERIEEIAGISDYLTRIESEKHPFQNGIYARKGVEF